MKSIKSFLSILSAKNSIRKTDNQIANRGTDALKLTRPLFGKVKILNLEIAEKEREKVALFNIKTFKKINKIITSDLDFLNVSQTVVDTIRKELGYVAGTLFLIDKENGTEYPYIISTDIIKKLEVIFGKPTSGHIGQLAVQDNFAVKCVSTKKAYIGNDLRDFVSPVLSYNKAHFIQKLFRMNTTVIIPLTVKDQVIGSLMVNSSKKEIAKDERILLSLFSDQISIAVYNARLYKELQIQLVRFQEKTRDLQSLLFLSQTSSAATEIKKTVQGILNIIPERLGHLKILGAVLVRYEENTSKVYAYAITESVLMQETVKLLSSARLADYSIFLNKSEPSTYTLTSRSILDGEIYKSEKLSDFICPPVKNIEAYLMQKSSGTRAIISVPISVRSRKLGALIFLFAKPLKDIGERELSLTRAFSEYLGVVLENFQFYNDLNKNIEELTRTKNNLEEILTMKNEFLRIVSHQLRTPLTAVRGLISMWKDGDFDNLTPSKVKEVKMRVANNIERLNSIINDMIKAIEVQGDLKLKFSPVNIEELIKDNIEILKSNYERRGLYLKYKKFDENIPQIEADKNLLSHIFLNLIDNAEKYTEKGGLEIALYRLEDEISVRFFDTGIGLSDHDKETLFKKFSRGEKSMRINPGGSGLGLFIVKQILDEHHGKIQVSSLGPGKGTTFVLSLPIKQPKPDLGKPH